jgi:hypothetical protein
MWQPNEREDLSNELHMIESTIRERENEITVNHMRMAAAAAADSGSNAFEGVVDYGLFGGVPGGKQQELEGAALKWANAVVCGGNSNRVGAGRG